MKKSTVGSIGSPCDVGTLVETARDCTYLLAANSVRLDNEHEQEPPPDVRASVSNLINSPDE